MKVLVTGGAGYIGSHAVRALQKAGHAPVVLDNLSHGHRAIAEDVLRVPLIVADLADRPAVDQLLRDHAIEAVLHFAAFTYVGESVSDPSRYYTNNVAGSLALLDALVAAGRERGTAPPPIVFSSTAATYGVPQQELFSEDHPTAPINPYGASKLVVERMLADFGRAYGLRSMIFRYFNAAGADPAADLADAHVLGLERLLASASTSPAIYNLGNGTGYSVQQVIDAARAVTGRDLSVVSAERREGDPPVLVASSAKARAELGWTPQYPDLAVILQHAWAWHQRCFPSPAGSL